MRASVILADNPWEFSNTKTGGSHKSGASQKYPTLALSAIQQLPVASVAAHSAALFLWVPSRLKFSHGLTTAQAWGFGSYQATLYWDKQRLGMGFWFRGQVEELLVFTRGDVAPFRCQEPNIKHLRAGEHSSKPEEFRRLIEKATGAPSKRTHLELFARQPAIGWNQIGHAITGLDIKQDLKVLASWSDDETEG